MLNHLTKQIVKTRPRGLESGRKKGFSMMEMLIVIGILALLALMALPATFALVPRAQLRAEAQNASTIMRQARLKAANTQRPTRVVFDCTPHTAQKSQPCIINMQTATFEDGAFKDWQTVALGSGSKAGHSMNPKVVATNAGGDDLMWVIFMPSSRAFTSEVKNFDGTNAPYEMVFLSENFGLNRDRASWYMTINSATGRSTLSGKR